ncbi:MAG: hypothetical protein ABI921_14760 [Panacibacter sp.]
MPFFDFHLHPTLKCLFSDENPAQEMKKLSPWEKLDTRRIPLLLRACTEFPYILQSQSNLAQLANNECNLICVALYIPEKDMLDNKLIKGQTTGPLKVYLHPDKVQAIINGNPYQLLINDDWNTLTNAAAFGITDRTVKPLKKRADYNEQDTNTIHAVFSVEGCHTLSSALQKFNVNEIIANLDDLRSRVAVLSVNLTHIEQSPLCNQAFAIQFIDKPGFLPSGNQMNADGIKVLMHCYSNKIMIDIKHMSLASRQQLYNLRTTAQFAAINQPIVCTHAGFTGIGVKEIPDYILDYRRAGTSTRLLQGKPLKYGDRARPCFNASSINLYDEDIMAVLNSGGIIGLSLDKRILGYQEFEEDRDRKTDYPVETEYVSAREESLFLPRAAGAEIGNAFNDGRCMDWDEIDEGGEVNPVLGDYHLKHFMAHLLHLVVVAGNNAYDVNKALTQVCIGSDFDGLINPIWVCDTVDEMVYFKQSFEKAFVQFASDSNVALPAGFDVKKFSNMLFFENGRDFVLNRLDVLNT